MEDYFGGSQEIVKDKIGRRKIKSTGSVRNQSNFVVILRKDDVYIQFQKSQENILESKIFKLFVA